MAHAWQMTVPRLAGAWIGMLRMAFDVKISDGIRGIDVDGDTPLPRVSRDVLAMTGTKFGCGMGPCGARAMHVDGVATRFCLTTIVSIGTSEITTIEAIGETMPGARIQQAWFDREVVQCGNRQPGQIMSASALLSLNSQPTDADTDDAMAGNVRRCGTYARIREVIRHAALLTGRGTAGDPRDKRPVPARVAANRSGG